MSPPKKDGLDETPAVVEADTTAEAIALSGPGKGRAIFIFPWGGKLWSFDAAKAGLR